MGECLVRLPPNACDCARISQRWFEKSAFMALTQAQGQGILFWTTFWFFILVHKGHSPFGQSFSFVVLLESVPGITRCALLWGFSFAHTFWPLTSLTCSCWARRHRWWTGHRTRRRPAHNSSSTRRRRGRRPLSMSQARAWWHTHWNGCGFRLHRCGFTTAALIWIYLRRFPTLTLRDVELSPRKPDHDVIPCYT